MLRSDFCDYSDPYIVVMGRITIRDNNNVNRISKKLTFKNNTPFRSCMLKVNNWFTDNAEDLDIVIPMHNLLEYSHNYSMISESLWNYYRDEINDDVNENDNNNRMNNSKTMTSKSSEYKTKLVERTPNINNMLDAENVIPLKCLSNFWRSLDLPLINCEIELNLSWSDKCVISETSRTWGAVGNLTVQQVAAAPTVTIFQINKF